MKHKKETNGYYINEKNEISKMKNLLEAVKCRIHLAEVMTSELETIARKTKTNQNQKID